MSASSRLLFITVVLLSFISCDKKDDPASSQACYLQKLEHIYGGGIMGSIETIKYDGAKATSWGYDSLLYNDDGNLSGYLVVSIIGGPSKKHEFTYSGGDLVMHESFRTFDGSVEWRETYEYNNHRLTKLQQWIYDPNDDTWKEGNYKTFEYSDDTNNVSKMTFTNPFFIPVYITTEEYTYDSGKSPYSFMSPAIQKWLTVLELPIDKARTKVTYPNDDAETFEYSFDTNMRPTSMKRSQGGAFVESQKYTYICD